MTRLDFAPIVAVPPARRVARAVAAAACRPACRRAAPADESDRLVGTLVHRLLQRDRVSAADVERRVDRRAPAAADSRPRSRSTSADREPSCADAAAAYRAFAAHQDVRALYLSGDRLPRGAVFAADRRSDRSRHDRLSGRGRRRRDRGPRVQDRAAHGPEHEAQADARTGRRAVVALSGKPCRYTDFSTPADVGPAPEPRIARFSGPNTSTKSRLPAGRHRPRANRPSCAVTASLSALRLPDSSHTIEILGRDD